MGQKVHPTGLRLGIVKDHTSVWYADGPAYRDKLLEDLEVREFLQKRLAQASVSRIEIQRPANTARITIHTARPGIVIGKKGEDVERLRQVVARMMGVPVHINIEEIRKPEIDAFLVAQNVAQQLERRVQFHRAMPGAAVLKVSKYALPGDWVVRKSHDRKVTSRVECRCTHCVRTSITR